MSSNPHTRSSAPHSHITCTFLLRTAQICNFTLLTIISHRLLLRDQLHNLLHNKATSQPTSLYKTSISAHFWELECISATTNNIPHYQTSSNDGLLLPNNNTDLAAQVNGSWSNRYRAHLQLNLSVFQSRIHGVMSIFTMNNKILFRISITFNKHFL